MSIMATHTRAFLNAREAFADEACALEKAALSAGVYPRCAAAREFGEGLRDTLESLYKERAERLAASADMKKRKRLTGTPSP